MAPGHVAARRSSFAAGDGRSGAGRAPNSKGDARHLDIEEEGLAIGGEGRSRHLGVEGFRQALFFQGRIRDHVLGQHVALAFRRKTDQAVHATPILGDNDVAPGRDGDVVRAIEPGVVAAGVILWLQHAGAVPALVEELQGVRGRDVAEDLSQTLFAAVGVAEPERATGEVCPLEAVELERLFGQGVLSRTLGVDVDPDSANALALIEEIGVVGLR